MTDLTVPVMDKVMKIEKHRILAWLTVLLVVAGVLLVIALAFLVISAQLISDRGSWDLLSLFQEDREIIAEFWQDTLLTFWEELPQRHLLVAILAAGALGIFLLVTRKSRKIARRKWGQIRKYLKSPTHQ